MVDSEIAENSQYMYSVVKTYCVFAVGFVMQVEYPVFWTAEEFCDGFIKLIDFLELDKVSINFVCVCVCVCVYTYAHMTSILYMHQAYSHTRRGLCTVRYDQPSIPDCVSSMYMHRYTPCLL